MRRAAGEARAARMAEKALARSVRARARLEKERMKTPETRREVHSFHVKRTSGGCSTVPTVRLIRGEAEDIAQDKG